MQNAFVCDAVRSPIGRYGGALSRVRPDDLAAIDEVLMGCANESGEDNRNVAQMSLLLAGLPFSVPGVTINRLCGSGMEAVGSAMRAIRSDEMQLAIAGGIEPMTRAPLVMAKSETGFGRSQTLEHTTMGWRPVNPLLDARYNTETMPRTAENIAEQFGILCEDQDAFALRSQLRAAAAQDAGYFAPEIVAVEVTAQKRVETIVIESDEHLRPDTTMGMLSALRPLFSSDGTVTAGNASGINDGAAAMIIANQEVATNHELSRRA